MSLEAESPNPDSDDEPDKKAKEISKEQSPQPDSAVSAPPATEETTSESPDSEPVNTESGDTSESASSELKEDPSSEGPDSAREKASSDQAESDQADSPEPEDAESDESGPATADSVDEAQALTETKVKPDNGAQKLNIRITESKRSHPEDVLDTKSLADLHREKGFEQDLLETTSLNKLRSTRGSSAGSKGLQSSRGTGAGTDRIKKAYGLVNNLLRDRLETEDDENLELLDGLKASDVLVVNGTYDHIHLVLENLKIPFLTTFPNALPVQELRPDQTIFVNCGRDFPMESAFVLEKFVRNGGQMISTDWALKTVLQVAFPRYLAYNRRPTKDEVVGIQVMDKDDPVLAGFIDEEENPVWWLEDASYPIRILDKSNVEVLIRSEELGKRYGADAVLVKFHHGEGVVYHMISHFYLQRAETRSAKQKSKASSYAKSKGASEATLAQFKLVEEASGDMDYGLTQTAMTSAEFVSRSILSQRKRFLNKTKNAPSQSTDNAKNEE